MLIEGHHPLHADLPPTPTGARQVLMDAIDSAMFRYIKELKETRTMKGPWVT
jgi:hypothetical protein